MKICEACPKCPEPKPEPKKPEPVVTPPPPPPKPKPIVPEKQKIAEDAPCRMELIIPRNLTDRLGRFVSTVREIVPAKYSGPLGQTENHVTVVVALDKIFNDI